MSVVFTFSLNLIALVTGEWNIASQVKEKKLSIGVYPDISLADARVKRNEARKLLAEGNDPAE